MDPGFPPGGLERMFAQVDAIRSHLPRYQPSPIDPNPSPSNPPPRDEPPWWSPEEIDASTDAVAPMNDKPAYNDGFAKLIGVGSMAAPKAMNGLRNAELMEPLLGASAEGVVEAAGIGAAEFIPGISLGVAGIMGLNYLEDNMPKEQDFETPVQPGEVTFEVDGKSVPAKTFHNKSTPTKVEQQPATFKHDEEGLTKAYSNPKGTSYDPTTQTEYVRGSVTPRDWFDDFSLIPFGNTAYSERYSQAMKTYNDLQSSGQPVKRVVGHSLGGSVALEMQKNLAKKGRNVETRTFGAPVTDLAPFGRVYKNVERYRHPLDPVSVLDRSAKWGKFKPYSHSYTDFEDFDK